MAKEINAELVFYRLDEIDRRMNKKEKRDDRRFNELSEALTEIRDNQGKRQIDWPKLFLATLAAFTSFAAVLVAGGAVK